MPYPLPVPKRRGLREDSAKDGGDAENEECGEAHGALPRLAVAIVWWAMEGKYTYLRTYLLTHLLTNSLVYCTNGLQSAPASVPGGYRELVSPTEAVLGMGPEPCKPLSLAIGHRHALYKGGSNSHRCPPRLMGRLGGSCVLRLGRNRILCLCLLHRRTLGRVHHLLLGRLLSRLLSHLLGRRGRLLGRLLGRYRCRRLVGVVQEDLGDSGTCRICVVPSEDLVVLRWEKARRAPAIRRGVACLGVEQQ